MVFNLSNSINKIEFPKGVFHEVVYTDELKEFIKRIIKKIDKIDLPEEASIQDYLVEAEEIIKKEAGDKLTDNTDKENKK